MAKRKRTNRNESAKTQYSNKKKNLVVKKNLINETNDDDFLDNTSSIMDKRKKHLNDFYNSSKHVSGSCSIIFKKCFY
jgi:hypothetical protein